MNGTVSCGCGGRPWAEPGDSSDRSCCDSISCTGRPAGFPDYDLKTADVAEAELLAPGSPLLPGVRDWVTHRSWMPLAARRLIKHTETPQRIVSDGQQR